MCCEKCDFWVHIECDGISQRGFDYLASRGEDYVCPHCAGREQLTYGKSLEAKIVAKLEAKAAAQQAAGDAFNEAAFDRAAKSGVITKGKYRLIFDEYGFTADQVIAVRLVDDETMVLYDFVMEIVYAFVFFDPGII